MYRRKCCGIFVRDYPSQKFRNAVREELMSKTPVATGKNRFGIFRPSSRASRASSVQILFSALGLEQADGGGFGDDGPIRRKCWHLFTIESTVTLNHRLIE